jgi:hypothetical protein
MNHLNESLRQELLAMSEADLSVRQELIEDGELTKYGYHPRMEAVHKTNASCLKTVIEQHGWPGKSLVGEDGANAAWLIAQHAISDPPFMRQCLSLLKRAALENEVPQWQGAMLEDRIRMYEGEAQVYGTQFQPDEDGNFVPYKIENPESVNDRRRAVGLNSLEERLAEIREQTAVEKIPLPGDWEKQYERWLRSVGWRD